MEAKILRTIITAYYLFKSERLSAGIKLTLLKTLIRLVMTYTWPAWEFAADNQLLKFQSRQNKVLRITGKFPRCTPVREFYMACHVSCIYHYIIKLCRQHAEVIQKKSNVRDIRKEARHKNYKKLNLGGDEAYSLSSHLVDVVTWATC
jgi:hypothetical protein